MKHRHGGNVPDMTLQSEGWSKAAGAASWQRRTISGKCRTGSRFRTLQSFLMVRLDQLQQLIDALPRRHCPPPPAYAVPTTAPPSPHRNNASPPARLSPQCLPPSNPPFNSPLLARIAWPRRLCSRGTGFPPLHAMTPRLPTTTIPRPAAGRSLPRLLTNQGTC